MSGPGPVRRDSATAEFFDAAAEAVLGLRRCPSAHANEANASVCGTCGSPELAAAPASGRAELVSWSVVHGRDPGAGAGSGAGAGAGATVVGIVQLEEGPWWWTRLADVEPARLRVGDPLVVRFERPDGGDEAVPVFVPAT